MHHAGQFSGCSSLLQTIETGEEGSKITMWQVAIMLSCSSLYTAEAWNDVLACHTALCDHYQGGALHEKRKD